MKTINNTSLSLTDVGTNVTLYGFVANKRQMGHIVFIDLRDQSGIVQLVINDAELQVTKESVIQVTGQVQARKDPNPQLPTGAIEINVKLLTVLSRAAHELPFVVRDDLSAKEETRLQHRYLDLRRPKMQRGMMTRYKIIKAIRDFLDEAQFMEIETPILSKSTPEGARDFVVPTRHSGQFFALPQSPQLYKQLLIASGFERYFQIARVFRDEDARKDRQPEFTQLDLEMAFGNPASLQAMIEKMFVFIFERLNLKIKVPFLRMDYDHAINCYGTDKPDLRYDYQIVDGSSFFKSTTFNIFKTAPTIKYIYFDTVLSRSQIKKLELEAQKNGAKGLAYATKTGTTIAGVGQKFFPTEAAAIFKNKQDGTILLVGDKTNIVHQALGAVRVKLAEMFELAQDEYKFVWIENWPLFDYNDQTDRYEAAHHPFTKPAVASMSNFATDPAHARSSAYDLVLNGFEIGGGSERINDLELQLQMFKTLGLNPAQSEQQFGYFLAAFKYGLPPHLGIAFGIERIVMIVEKMSSIRDAIAFPKNAAGHAVMEQAPSQLGQTQLDEYHLRIKK